MHAMACQENEQTGYAEDGTGRREEVKCWRPDAWTGGLEDAVVCVRDAQCTK